MFVQANNDITFLREMLELDLFNTIISVTCSPLSINYINTLKIHEIKRSVFLCHLIDLKLLPPTDRLRLLLKFQFRVEFLDFRVSANS
jgi:hypothetical protein